MNKQKNSQRNQVLKTLWGAKGPVSSNYFVYHMYMARISAVIFCLRKDGYNIRTIRKPEMKVSTSYYIIGTDAEINELCEKNNWIIEK